MLKKREKIHSVLAAVLLTASAVFAKNSVSLTPVSGTIVIGTACTVTVVSEIPADSVGISVEYRSKQGTIRSKSVGMITTPPYKMVVPVGAFGNQYFFGADLIATVYRSDDTVQIVNSPRLFLLPEPIVPKILPYYPAGNSVPLPAGSEAISVVRDIKGVTISFDIPVKGDVNDETLEPVTIVLDPRLSRTPFPGSNTVILSVPLTGESELITSAERSDSSMFTISRTGTPIHLKKVLNLKDNRFSGTITIPDFLLGGEIRDTIGLNVIIPRPDGSGEPVSFVEGEKHLQYTPILFPLFIKAELPGTTPGFSFKLFGIWCGIGALVSVLLVLFRKRVTPTSASVKEPGSDLIILIQEHICNRELSVPYLAAKLGCSENHIRHEIKQVTGQSFSAYIESMRIEIVKERLASSNSSEIEIADACGFKNVTVMEDSFHHLTGIAPYQFRKRYGMK